MTGLSDSILTACLCLLNSIAFLSTNEGVCPKACVCSPHKRLGGISVRCVKQGLQSVPIKYHAETSEIILHDNNIELTPLDEHVFSNLKQLKKLDLSENLIKDIPINFFPTQLKHLNLSGNRLNSVEFKPPKLLRILDLSHNQLRNIQNGVFSGFPVLDTLLLNGNLFQSLSKEMFTSDDDGSDYETLRKLSLTGNKISNVAERTFSNLKNLIALTISSNRITSFSNNTFLGLEKLEFLDCSNNHISTIENRTFQIMKNIQYLYLKGNKLKYVPANVPMAEWLDLSDNLISRINESEKASLYTSEFFNLATNPLHCDCKLLWLKELWDRREHKVRHFDQPANFIPKCESPALLKGESWDELGDDVFKCDNDTDSTVSQVQDFNVDDFKNEIGRMVDKQRTLDIHPVLINTSCEQINISWELLEGFTFESGSLEIHYHVFGDINTLEHIILTMESDYITLKDLTADTGYVICIDFVHQSKDLSTPLSQCIEVKTAPFPYVFTINISLIVTVNALILKILGSIIFIVSFVGFAAVVLGAVTSQSKSWSSDLSEAELSKPRKTSTEGSEKPVEKLASTKDIKIE